MKWGFIVTHVVAGKEWEPLSVDSYRIERKHDENMAQKESLVSSMTSVRITESPSPLTSTLFDWGGDKEPVDIDRNMEDVTLVEVSWMVQHNC